MEIGVPKENKDQEFRVGLRPSSVRVLRENGHSIFVQTQAGNGAGFSDDDYRSAGAEIVPTSETAWNRELVVKVKTNWLFQLVETLLITSLQLLPCACGWHYFRPSHDSTP